MSAAGGPASFTAVRTVGGLLPGDLLGRVVEGGGLPGLASGDFHLAGEPLRQAASRAWEYLRGAYLRFRDELAATSEGDLATGLTRERWLQVLLKELDYGRVQPTPGGHLNTNGRDYPVSHLWQDVPIHLLGWRVDLDTRSERVAGAARAPQSMVQELLNRDPEHLWALLSNGRLLRVLRDSSALVGQAYVEFDLEAIFDGELFADFVLLFLVCHQSRVERLPDGDGEPGGVTDRWLERWRGEAIVTGTRALEQLRVGVTAAIAELGTGFLRHPGNAGLRDQLADGSLALVDLQRGLLRLVYRLLFWFVAEDRGGLLAPAADATARARYQGFFSSARLRAVARRRHGSRHTDLWQAVRLVFDGLGREGGRPELALPGLGGLFEHGPLDVLDGLDLANEHLLTAVRHLALTADRSGAGRRSVDFRNLGAEELGSVYESLLELAPRHDPATRTLTLQTVAGSERKTSGSYYTPTALIDLVLDTALDPLLDDAVKTADPETALLAVTVCDPACGSGHFLVAAARRIARRLAAVRTDEPEPAPTAMQSALHDVVERCIYGVDLNPMAAELARVSLWLEALEPGRPLSFLDANIRVGNALLGTTPALLAAGIPDAAFKPIEGDDKKTAAALAKRNRAERAAIGQRDLFDEGGLPVGNLALGRTALAVRASSTASLADVHVQAARQRALETSPERAHAKSLADAWCAAFVQPKTPDEAAGAVTDKVLRDLADHPETVPDQTRDLIQRLASEYRFFHWHIEFPEIFAVPDSGAGTATGWTGGFTAVLGNPPWERVKLQEQEFFASRDLEIALAPNAAARKRLIAALRETQASLWAEWVAASRRAQGESQLIRLSGRYPLCGVGDVNTYSVFAEHMRTTIAPAGRVGVITPTGLATDATTAPFFADTLRSQRLAAFYDFENEAKIFAGVHNQFRFAVTCMTGGERVGRVSFAFYTRYVADVPQRRFDLAPEEVLLLNPNTGTLPVFRSRVDAEITLGIYRRHPVLIRDGNPDGNPWGLSFMRMFDMATDSGLFRTAADLEVEGAEFDGWVWSSGDQRWLPLYEAKLLSHYDHRFSTYAGATQKQLNKGTLPRLTDAKHDDPDAEPLARYWVAEADVAGAIGDRWDRGWLLGFRRLTRSSDMRTLIPFVLPLTAVGDNTWIAITTQGEACLLQAAWSSWVADYLIRQKLSGTTLSAYIVEQLACPAPSAFGGLAGWASDRTASEFVTPRVLELSYTSHRIAPYARDLGDDGPPFRWIPERREMLRAELDGAMFHVYGLTRPEVEHVLDSFFVVRKYEERDHGEFRTKRLVLDRYDAMQTAIDTGVPYQTPLDPPPGHGPRHPVRASHQARD